MGWNFGVLLLIALALAGCLYPIYEKDSTTLFFLLERTLDGDEMSQEIAVIESRLSYLGFEVESIVPVGSLLLKARVKGKEFDGSDEFVLSAQGEIEVWVNDVYVFSDGDIVDYGEVRRREDGLWAISVGVTDDAAERFTGALRFYKEEEVVYNHILIDGGTARLTIEKDLRESAQNVRIDSTTFVFNDVSFADAIFVTKNFGQLPVKIVDIIEF